jgi:hypothetical protein
MHETLYTGVAKQLLRDPVKDEKTGEMRTERTAEGARNLVTVAARPYIKHVDKGRAEWYIALRGVQIAAEDAELVRKNIQSGAVWPVDPGPVAAFAQAREQLARALDGSDAGAMDGARDALLGAWRGLPGAAKEARVPLLLDLLDRYEIKAHHRRPSQDALRAQYGLVS